MFTELQNELKNCVDVPTIVEGKKDKRALQRLGFKKVLDISGQPLAKVVERVASEKFVIILTDFDEDGRKKASKLIKFVQSTGVKIDFLARSKIKSLFKVHEIEEINSFVKLMEDDYYGETCPIYDKIFDRSRVLNRRNCRKTGRNRSRVWADRRPAGRRS